MNVLSLFDGISCGQIALERAGIEVDNYFASEIEENSIKVTQANFPNTIQLGSVVDVKGDQLPNIDLLIGGSPCQGFSFAGKQLNFEDERSKLFFEFVRLLKETKPKYFLLENVMMKKKYQNIITEYLGVRPISIDSSRVSAQSRKRIYWTNIPGVRQPKNLGIKLSDIIESGEVDRRKSLCLTKRYEGFSGSQPYLRRRYFGKAMGQAVFEDCEPIEQKRMWKLDDRKEYTNTRGFVRGLSVLECERLQTLPDGYVGNVLDNDLNAKGIIGNGWTVDVISHILKGIKPQNRNKFFI